MKNSISNLIFTVSNRSIVSSSKTGSDKPSITFRKAKNFTDISQIYFTGFVKLSTNTTILGKMNKSTSTSLSQIKSRLVNTYKIYQRDYLTRFFLVQ